MMGEEVSVGSRKGSAKAKQRAEFAASWDGSGGFDELFAAEEKRRERADEEHEEALRRRACESKNRYPDRASAEEAIRSCAEYGRPGLRCYKCRYCNGWHLTSKAE